MKLFIIIKGKYKFNNSTNTRRSICAISNVKDERNTIQIYVFFSDIHLMIKNQREKFIEVYF